MNPRANPDIYGIGITYPDHFSNFYSGPLDNGGCHVNSGIAAKAFYLLSVGGTHPSNPNITMTGIGADKASTIWYNALPLMSASTTFASAATLQASTASSLYGSTSNELMAVQASWALCGVGSMPNPNVTDYISNPGFETAQYPWSTLGTSGVAWIKCCSGNNVYGTAGGYALLGYNNSISASIYQIVPAFTTNVNSATFSFYIRSFGNDMAVGSYDTLMVSVKNATSGGTFANLLTYYSRTNVFSSYTKIGPFDMMAYKGKGSLRIEFAVSNDFSTPTSWYIDDVYLNTTTY